LKGESISISVNMPLRPFRAELGAYPDSEICYLVQVHLLH